MTPPVNRIEWPASVRIIPSRYPPVGLFDRVAVQADLEAVFEVESLTNDRLRDQIGEIYLVPEEDRIYGEGTTPIMAAFTHPNTEGSRFSDGSFGIYYAGDCLDTAIAESRFHRERFLKYSSEPPIRLEMRTYYASVTADLYDLRSLRRARPELFDPDTRAYGVSQALGLELKNAGGNGLIYHSVRRQGGECIGIFRPTSISPATQGPHFEYIWDGSTIVEVLQVQRYSEQSSGF
jgi:hypothetical protein